MCWSYYTAGCPNPYAGGHEHLIKWGFILFTRACNSFSNSASILSLDPWSLLRARTPVSLGPLRMGALASFDYPCGPFLHLARFFPDLFSSLCCCLGNPLLIWVCHLTGKEQTFRVKTLDAQCPIQDGKNSQRRRRGRLQRGGGDDLFGRARVREGNGWPQPWITAEGNSSQIRRHRGRRRKTLLTPTHPTQELRSHPALLSGIIHWLSECDGQTCSPTNVQAHRVSRLFSPLT